jgi:hypothetical protein
VLDGRLSYTGSWKIEGLIVCYSEAALSAPDFVEHACMCVNDVRSRIIRVKLDLSLRRLRPSLIGQELTFRQSFWMGNPVILTLDYGVQLHGAS